MSKKNKFYIPLITFKGKQKQVTLINVEKIPDIKELIPSIEDILLNLRNQKPLVDLGNEYKPLRIKVTKEKFIDLENQIRKKKPNHKFIRKALDIISDTKTQLSIVQIVQI